MMRLAIFTGSFPNLSETFIIRKVAWLSERPGLSITVYSRRAEKVSHLKAGLPGVRLVYLPPFQNLQQPAVFLKSFSALLKSPFQALKAWGKKDLVNYAPLSSYARLMRMLPFMKESMDLAHFEFLSQGVTNSWVAKLKNIPYLVSCRGSEINNFQEKPASEQQLILEVLHKAGKIHCVSHTMAAKVRELLPAEMHEKVFVNFPAIDPAFYQPVLHTEKPVCRIIAVGRLEWVKGFDHLLQALFLLKQQGIAFQASIVGDGPLRNNLQFSMEDLGLQDCVKLEGPRGQDEVRDLLQQSDIFVLSSHSEGISNAVLEAMAAGLALLSTRCGGMHEVIRNRENGLMVEVRDCEGMANGMAELCKDAALRARLGANARASVEEHHDLRRQAEVFHQHYEELLS